jgi:transcriptional regulator with XRE-family HTH domain
VNELRRLGKKLAQCRTGADLTQEKAAELAGITLRFYQDLEAGRKAPSYLTLRRLAGAYRVKSWDQMIP